MPKHMAERLRDWGQWYFANKLRLPLYYVRIPSKDRQRLAFIAQMHVGILELWGIAIDDMRQAWLLKEGGNVPRALMNRIERCVHWYKQNMNPHADTVKQWQFLLEGQAKLLEIAMEINQELDALNRATTSTLYEQAEDVLPRGFLAIEEGP